MFESEFKISMMPTWINTVFMFFFIKINIQKWIRKFSILISLKPVRNQIFKRWLSKQTLIFSQKFKNYVSRTSWGRPQKTSYERPHMVLYVSGRWNMTSWGRPHIVLYVTPGYVPYQCLQNVSCRRYEDISIWSNT